MQRTRRNRFWSWFGRGTGVGAATVIMLALTGGAACAQNLDMYLGAAVGAFDHDTPQGGAFSDAVRSWKVYAGFQLTDYFGFEAAWTSL